MKFKDPKTGEVFEFGMKQKLYNETRSHCNAYSEQSQSCKGCKFDFPKCEYSCEEWAAYHPAEAARLMGYEVVEEDLQPTCNNLQPCNRREDNMDKQKPPLGVTPEHIWKEKRYEELCGAIGRYLLAGLDPLPEWIEEGKRLLKEVQDG